MIVIDDENDRYHRQNLIPWWDQDLLASTRVLLVGAGALGNEIAKNLALVGFGSTLVVDMDRIERSNLARCALFRESDEGRDKATVVAERMIEINPGITAEAFVGPIEALGAGVLESADVVIAGLDSRIARLWLNRAARRFGTPWVDGAIEGVRGLARVFLPQGPCYECTLGEADRRVLAARRSCALLTAEQMLEGKVPTNATTAAIIGGIEVQEAIKLVHGREDLPVLAGRAFMYAGETIETYTIDYSEDEWCASHEVLGPRQRVTYGAHDTLHDLAAECFGSTDHVVVQLDQEIVRSAMCSACSTSSTPQRALRSFGAGELVCAGCSEVFALDVATRFEADSDLAALPISTLGLARHDVAVLESPTGFVTVLLEEGP
jgi:molybdopterin/thiamine biosynthesis adenylyltransferase